LSNIRRFDFADSQNRSTLQKPIAAYRLFPNPADTVNQVKAQKEPMATHRLSPQSVDKVKIGHLFR
jgi:hypothetical protein